MMMPYRPDLRPYCEYIGDALDAAACDNPVTKVVHLRIDDQDETFFCCSVHVDAFVEEEADRYERTEDYRPNVPQPAWARPLVPGSLVQKPQKTQSIRGRKQVRVSRRVTQAGTGINGDQRFRPRT
jgi:hypothetical protein